MKINLKFRVFSRPFKDKKATIHELDSARTHMKRVINLKIEELVQLIIESN